MDQPPAPRSIRLRAWGLVFSVVWLIFLIGPTVDAFGEGTLGGRLVGVSLIAFAALYVVFMQGMRRFFHAQPDPRLRTVRLTGLGMVLITAGLLWAGRPAGLGTLPFLAVASVVLFARWSIVAVALIAGVAELISRSWFGTWSDPYGVAIGSIISGGSVWGFTMFMARNQALVRAAQAEGELALGAERDRFARDLHDLLGHSLTVISVKAALAGRRMEVGSETANAKARTEVADLERLARDALADVRRTVAGYREITLPGELSRARAALVAAGIRPELPNTAEAVESPLRELFAWTVREGVTNVVRHSEASTCTVSLGPRSVTVADDGRGLAEDVAPGSGLHGLRERAAAVGAGVTTEAGMPRGFVLRVAAPEPAVAS